MGLVLITGANGFVGKALCTELLRRNILFRAAVREGVPFDLGGSGIVRIPSISAGTDWARVLSGVTTVIHLAARVHVLSDDASNPLDAFRKVNVSGTEQLARSAASHGVKRLVYVSSIKVNGELTRGNELFMESSPPLPRDFYGMSKWEAEQTLARVAIETGLEVVIVRPPLVYGPEVKGNFSQMLKVLRSRTPLPLASVQNLRSLIYVGNLVDALIRCTTHPAAAMQTYLVSDGEDISTPNLLRVLSTAMGHSAILLPCPVGLLRLGGQLLGKSGQIERLLSSLRVDSRKIRRELDWAPPFTLHYGLCATAT